MTTAGAANVHAIAIEGNFDDCQAMVKGMFNDRGFRETRRACRRQFDQLGADHGPGRLLLLGGAGARRAAPAGRLHRADRQFRRYLRRLCRQADGPADRAADHRHQRQRHPGAHACERRLRPSTVTATASPSMDIQVSSNFERLLFEAHGRDARRRAPADERPREQSRRFTIAEGAARPIRADFAAGRDGRGARPPRPSARPGARPASCSTRTPRSASRSRGVPPRRHADGHAGHGASGEIPRRGRARHRPSAAAAGRLDDFMTRPEDFAVLANSRAASKNSSPRDLAR